MMYIEVSYFAYISIIESRGSSVSMVTAQRSGLPGANFSHCHRTQTGFGTYPMVTVRKAAPSVDVKNAWSYTCTPTYALMAWCIIIDC